jgi:hypothetical protein
MGLNALVRGKVIRKLNGLDIVSVGISYCEYLRTRASQGLDC